MIFDERHPINLIGQIDRLHGSSLSYEFSKYRYEPQAVEDPRKIYRVGSQEVSSWFQTVIPDLAPKEDIAFHSLVRTGDGRSFHIPMVDFMEKPDRSDMRSVKEALRAFDIDGHVIFDSGRSLHLYGIALLSHEQWIRFCGRVLLLNPPGKKQLVDDRWIGHRLIAGYATLRWTKNNPRYVALPRLIEESEL